MKAADPRQLVAAAWFVAGVATLASLNFSGIPPLGWTGMGFVPCDLCWYQRILMYPLVLLLGLTWWRMERSTLLGALGLAGAGVVVAAYHSLVEINPDLEIGACSVVTCAVSPWALGGLTIPNLSLIAFTLVTGAVATVLWLQAGGRTRVQAGGRTPTRGAGIQEDPDAGRPGETKAPELGFEPRSEP